MESFVKKEKKKLSGWEIFNYWTMVILVVVVLIIFFSGGIIVNKYWVIQESDGSIREIGGDDEMKAYLNEWLAKNKGQNNGDSVVIDKSFDINNLKEKIK